MRILILVKHEHLNFQKFTNKCILRKKLHFCSFESGIDFGLDQYLAYHRFDRYIRYRFANHQKRNTRPKSADVEIKKITSIDSHFRWVIEKFKYEISPSENFYNWGLPSSWAQPVFLSPAWNANRDETSAAKNLQKKCFSIKSFAKKIFLKMKSVKFFFHFDWKLQFLTKRSIHHFQTTKKWFFWFKPSWDQSTSPLVISCLIKLTSYTIGQVYNLVTRLS